jgi:thioredoxin 1
MEKLKLRWMEPLAVPSPTSRAELPDSKVMVISVSSHSEFKSYINQGKLTVVDFYADWCGPCRAVAPRYDQLSSQYPSVNFLKVNTDTQEQIASEEQISAMPTFVFYKGGRRIHTITGADIRGVEQFVRSNQGAQSFGGTGHKLGSGASTSTATSTANSSWTTDQFMLAGLLALFAYLYFNK